MQLLNIFGDLEELIADDLYPYRYAITPLLVLALSGALWVAYRMGLHRLVARNPVPSAAVAVPLTIVAIVAGALVVYFFWRTPRSDDKILGALALLLAGIAGNVTDRMRFGYVIDFIDVQFGSWHYPTFNVADMAICVGAGLLILDMFLSKRNAQAETRPVGRVPGG